MNTTLRNVLPEDASANSLKRLMYWGITAVARHRLARISTAFLAVCTLAVLQLAGITAAVPQSAPPASDGQWPKPFELRGSEPASFGFVVTQPGPLQIEVRWQGSPLVIELHGPRDLVQPGVRLAYQVTPADVQRSIFWLVRVSQQSAAAAPVGGAIVLQRPPVDWGVAQVQLRSIDAQRAARGVEPEPQRSVQHSLEFMNRFQGRVARTNQEQLNRQAAVERQFQAVFNLPGGGQTASRGVLPAGVSAVREQLLTRSTPATGGETAANTRPLAAPVAPAALLGLAAPAITALTPAGGQPGDTVMISGSGFGAYNGNGARPYEVHFVLNPGKEFIAQVERWTDGQIQTRVPNVTGVVAAQASVYVVVNGARTTTRNFQFSPRLEGRTYFLQGNDFGSYISQPGLWLSGTGWPDLNNHGYDYTQRPNGGVKHQNSDVFIGHKGNDYLFRGVTLSAGWVVEDVIFDTYYADRAGAYVDSIKIGSNTPVLSVRWWVDGYAPLVQQPPRVAYTLGVLLRGPAGVPDGWACKTAPCK